MPSPLYLSFTSGVLSTWLLGAAPSPDAEKLREMFVVPPAVDCLDSKEARQVVRRLEAGQAVQAEEEWVAVRRQGYVRVHLPDGTTCLVLGDKLSLQLHEKAVLWLKAVEHLQEGRLYEAQDALKRTYSEDPMVLSLEAALSDAVQGLSRELDAQPRELPARQEPAGPPVLVAETVPPKVGARRHVLATRLWLRSEPRENAPVLAELRLNTAVRVESVEGEFTRVVVEPVPQRVVQLALAGKLPRRSGDAPATDLRGYVGWAFLGQEPVQVERLLEQAEAYESQGRTSEATLVLERAALLRPWETRLLQRLIRLGLASERYAVVAWAAAQLAQPRPGLQTSLELVFGCRGNRESAVIIGHPQLLLRRGAELPASVCVSGVRTGATCKPCEPATPGEPEEEKKRAMAEYEETLERWRRAERERQRANAVLRYEYIDGPWLRVAVEGSPVHAGARLWVYGVAAEVETLCEEVQRLTYELAHLSQEPLVVPAQGERLVAWVRVRATDGMIYGLISADTAEQARASVQSALQHPWFELSGWNFHRRLPAPTVSGRLRRCVDCCGC